MIDFCVKQTSGVLLQSQDLKHSGRFRCMLTYSLGALALLAKQQGRGALLSAILSLFTCTATEGAISAISSVINLRNCSTFM